MLFDREAELDELNFVLKESGSQFLILDEFSYRPYSAAFLAIWNDSTTSYR
jgi:hypothetical protein